MHAVVPHTVNMAGNKKVVVVAVDEMLASGYVMSEEHTVCTCFHSSDYRDKRDADKM